MQPHVKEGRTRCQKKAESWTNGKSIFISPGPPSRVTVPWEKQNLPLVKTLLLGFCYKQKVTPNWHKNSDFVIHFLIQQLLEYVPETVPDTTGVQPQGNTQLSIQELAW